MAINTQITKKYPDNTVQVEVKSGNAPVRYYKVPDMQADSFQAEYKQNSKKFEWTSTGCAIAGLFIGMVPSYFLLKKHTPNKALRSIINIGAGFLGCFAGSYIGAKLGIKNYHKLLDRFNAEEIEEPVHKGLPI